VIVDHAGSLHPCVDDGGPDEFEAALLEFFRDGFGEWREGWDGAGVLDRLASGEIPGELGEVGSGLLHAEIDARAKDGGFNFGASADDAGVLHEAFDVGFFEAGDFGRVELVEGGTEGFALAEDGDPGEPGLEALEHEELPEGAGVGFGDAPFLVVVGEVERVGSGPGASGFCLFGGWAHVVTIVASGMSAALLDGAILNA
jgi:hypothetical protein